MKKYFTLLFLFIVVQTSCSKLGNKIAYGSKPQSQPPQTKESPRTTSKQKKVATAAIPTNPRTLELEPSLTLAEEVRELKYDQKADRELFSNEIKQLQGQLTNQTQDKERYVKQLGEASQQIGTLESKIKQLEEKIDQITKTAAKPVTDRATPLETPVGAAVTTSTTAIGGKTKTVGSNSSIQIAQVYFCKNSSDHLFHSLQCSKLAKCRTTANEVTMVEAQAMGYSACKVCY
jgi:predicted RNase H-like nuclease (RuvC/YqgF family)